VFACIDSIDGNGDDHINFCGLAHCKDGSILVNCMWGAEYSVSPIALNKIEE
jgi:hypothetical protein